jgi:RHS repeat-associated protein
VLQTTHGTQRTDYVSGHERLLALDGTAQTWYGSDALGSVRQTLDGSGSALSALHYDPWGTPQGSVQPPTFGFTGELQDGMSGLVYLRARWYPPQHGRFTSRDVWQGMPEEPQTLAPYTYTHSDPVNYIDPTGHWRWRRTGSTYHQAIEDFHLARSSPRNVHLEFDDLRGVVVDVLHSNTGDVYEIEPITKWGQAGWQAAGYVAVLNNQRVHLHGEWTGDPKRSLPPGARPRYNWTTVNWQLGQSWNFEAVRIPNFVRPRPPFGGGDLAARVVAPGEILYWIEPAPGVTVPALKQNPNLRNQQLVRPRNYVPNATPALNWGSVPMPAEPLEDPLLRLAIAASILEAIHGGSGGRLCYMK